MGGRNERGRGRMKYLKYKKITDCVCDFGWFPEPSQNGIIQALSGSWREQGGGRDRGGAIL